MIIQKPLSEKGERIRAGHENHEAARSEAVTPILGLHNRTTRGSWPVLPKTSFLQDAIPIDGSDPTIPAPDNGGTFTPGPDGGTNQGHCFAFEAWANPALSGIIMEPGDIMIEPGDNSASPSQWIPWASITGNTLTPTVTATNVCVWLSIDIFALTATMHVTSESVMQSYYAGLSAPNKKITTVRPLVITTWAAGVITKVKGKQCGDVIISRV